MSKSDTCIEASRELLRYMKEDGTNVNPERNDPIARSIVMMLIYVVKAEAAAMDQPVTEDAQKHSILVFRQHLEDTPDWTGSVESRLEDFNVIHASLRDPNFKPEYVTL